MSLISLDNNNKYDKTVWAYKKVIDTELSNRNLEFIISFYDQNKFELNINKFSSLFDLDIDSFLEMEGDDKNNNKLPDDIFKSDYHHSLIIGTYKMIDEQNILLILEKIFTNQEKLFNENEKKFKLIRNQDGFLLFEKNTVFYNLKFEFEEIKLKLIKQHQ